MILVNRTGYSLLILSVAATIALRPLTSDAKTGVTKLLKAAEAGDVATIRSLLDAGTDINGADASGMTALISTLYFPTEDKGTQALELLLKRGANTKIADGQGDTPLMYAARSFSPAHLRVLLRAKPELNTRNKKGETALMQAINQLNTDDNPKKDIFANIDLLIRAGANLNMTDNNGNTALMRCVKMPWESNLIHKLIESGTDVKIRNTDGQTAAEILHERPEVEAVRTRKPGAEASDARRRFAADVQKSMALLPLPEVTSKPGSKK